MNVEWIGQLPDWLRSQLYFSLQRIIGARVNRAWKDFQVWAASSPTSLAEKVDERLSATLDSALGDVEHYRDLRLPSRGKTKSTEFIKQFPILDRSLLRERFPNLVTDALRNEILSPDSISKKRYGWLVVKTGGTTGEPTAVVHDAWFRDYGRATRLYSQSMCGFPLGTRYFRLWGNEQELLQTHESIDRRLLRNLLGEIPMNAFRAKEDELIDHLRTMKSHPEIASMMAYVDAAAGFAEFIQNKNLEAPRVEKIMACAGTVTNEWRDLLSDVFQAEVFDKYGSRECADIACECTAHNGLHIYSPNVYVEVVDENGKDCPPGETGRILVTLLNNLSFPMIRYEIGDLAIPHAEDEPCDCGLAFPRIHSIQGRSDEMLTTQTKTKVSSVFVRHFVGVSLNKELIGQWQLEQTAPLQFVFRYVPRNASTDRTLAPNLKQNLEDLSKAFRLAFGEKTTTEFIQCEEIPPSSSGKIRWIINSSR